MSEPPPPSRDAPASMGFLRVLPVVFILGAVAAFFVLDGPRYVNLHELARLRQDLTGWVAAHHAAAPYIYIAGYALVIACSLPIGAPATMLGGLVFGPLFGTVWAVTGATLGAAILALVARTALGDALRKRAGPLRRRIEDGFRAGAFHYVLVLRLIPVFPFWLVNLVPAFIPVPLTTYILATFYGILPATFLYSGVGHGLGMVLSEGQAPGEALSRLQIFLPIIGLIALAILPFAFRRSRQAEKGVTRSP